MATNSYAVPEGACFTRSAAVPFPPERASAPLVLLGRFLFTAIFLLAAPMHFTHAEIAYAATAGVPFADWAVPLSGLIAGAGGLSVLLGYRARLGAWLLILFLVPVTLAMHNFWAVKDPVMAQIQMADFAKNIGLIGGALVVAQLGAGPWSLDARRPSR